MATRYVALLRGINVGRAKRVAMADYRALLEGLGHTEVKTLLISGNAVFTSDENDVDRLAVDIEKALLARVGVQSTVVIRTAAELAAVVRLNPLEKVASDGSKQHVGFLRGNPKAGAAGLVAAMDLAPDVAVLDGRELYLWCPNGLSGSTFVKLNWDRELGVPVTMRNWNTVLKVTELLGRTDQRRAR